VRTHILGGATAAVLIVGGLVIQPQATAADASHTSCRAAGQLAASLARAGLVGQGASTLGQSGPGAVAGFVADTHAALCLPR
jgi:hypothetical protein